jgi:imidazole glycerol phosphate synthase subunit HisF
VIGLLVIYHSLIAVQAVVISIDPRRVYVADPSECPHETVKTSKAGPNGEAYVWWQCTVKGGREGRPIGAVELSRAVRAPTFTSGVSSRFAHRCLFSPGLLSS